MFGIRKSGLAVHDYRSPLKTHVDLLPPGLNCGLDSGFLGQKGVGQIELSFGYSGSIMLLDREFCRESAVLKLARPSLDDIALVSLSALHGQSPLRSDYRTGRISTQNGPPIAYYRHDNSESCLGCVTDWQQETRGLFLLASVAGDAIRFYPHRRVSTTRNSKHLRQAHSKFLSARIAKWPHLPQTNRPSATAAIGLNSSPETQYVHPTIGTVTRYPSRTPALR
jgi:hypothetical protein